MPTQYVLYRRVSTEEQGKSCLGLEAQDRDIRLYLETYSPTPWEVLRKFTEVESSANGDRPELAKAIELTRKTRDTLLVSKLDRRRLEFPAFNHDGELGAPPGFCSRIGGLLPMAPCGRSSL